MTLCTHLQTQQGIRAYSEVDLNVHCSSDLFTMSTQDLSLTV